MDRDGSGRTGAHTGNRVERCDGEFADKDIGELEGAVNPGGLYPIIVAEDGVAVEGERCIGNGRS